MKSPAYPRAKALIEANYIKDFVQLVEEIQKKTLAADLHMHFNTLMARANDPGRWTIAELAELSDLLDIEHSTLLTMADILRKKKQDRNKRRK